MARKGARSEPKRRTNQEKRLGKEEEALEGAPERRKGLQEIARRRKDRTKRSRKECQQHRQA